MNRAPVTVVGAGVTGLTTALALHEAGYPVRVVDPAEPGSGTSAANGAQLSWAFVAPLAEPAVLPKLPGWLLRTDSPIRWMPRPDPALPGWGLAFLRACTRRRVRATTTALLELAALGRPQLDDWRRRHALDFDWRANGKLLVYRDDEALTGARRQVDFQRRLGVEQRLIDRDALLEREPALSHLRDRLAGALWTPSEAVGDCRRFCEAVAAHLDDQGVAFSRRRVERLETRHGRLVAWHDDRGERHGQAPGETLIVAAGLASRRLLAPTGIRLPLYPLKGYSLTLPLGTDDPAFDASITDTAHKMVYARLGQDESRRLRIAGIADLDGWQTSPHASRVDLLRRRAREFLPALTGRIAAAEAWTGLRPATPDGRPRLGPTVIDGLWVNAGQGALGWTLAPGSALALRAALDGDDTAIAPFRGKPRR
ncbi:FAD-dependent oxidoreductase [Halomonas sp. HP20-15]|uniref:FAD-dependent oxidoreductase n=1 Tax=Halomonas sp. HP20-15 TaxID=3085901 RepID=UPI002980A55C|nr:FAD-dependent oxidoreductase [Halomonas sp. HP20-15]MDW5377071.1 FAD-dependent oxidoreductase [Halomonas sp. HP20-15]